MHYRIDILVPPNAVKTAVVMLRMNNPYQAMSRADSTLVLWERSSFAVTKFPALVVFQCLQSHTQSNTKINCEQVYRTGIIDLQDSPIVGVV